MMKTKMMHGDLMDRLAEMPAASCHGCFCDPPYHLTQATRNGSPRINNPETPFGRTRLGSKGFMGKTWDGGDIAFQAETWAAVLRVLKPGAPLLAFGGTKTFHRLTCAIEDAGFEIRDCLMWLYGSGFPKSLDVSKAIDAAAGMERKVVGTVKTRDLSRHGGKIKGDMLVGVSQGSADVNITAPATPAARLWHGWGSALKPAWEPVVLAMKPLDKNFANNALTHGVAGLNVDGGRIAINETLPKYRTPGNGQVGSGGVYEGGYRGAPPVNDHPDSVRHNANGRWPANLILSHTDSCRMVGVKRVKGTPPTNVSRSAGVLKYGGQNVRPHHGSYQRETTEGHADADGLETVEAWECSEDCPVRLLDEQSGESTSTGGDGYQNSIFCGGKKTGGHGLGDSGTASRFFYTAKAGRGEREQGLRGQIPCVQCGDKDTKHHVTHGQQVHHLRAAGRDGIPSIADIRRMWTTYKRNGHKGTSPEWNLADCIRNNHPTVKPLSVATYLAKLILPPAQDQPRRLLVPFAGVASEMIGAIRAGWDEVVGIELEAGSVAIGKARLKHAKDRIARNHSFSILQI